MSIEHLKKGLASVRKQRSSDLVSLPFWAGYLAGIALLGSGIGALVSCILRGPIGPVGLKLGIGMIVGGVVIGIASFVCMYAIQTWQLKREPKLVRALGTPGRDEAAFRELMKMGNRAVPLLLEALASPSAQFVTSAEPWDGDLAHCHAITGLASLKTREAVEPLLAELQQWGEGKKTLVQSLKALGEIGDLRAVPGIVPLLGVRKLAKAAGSTLGVLGQSELVRAFEAAVHRGECEELRVYLRPEIAEALMNALDYFADATQRNSAHALGELGVREAVPRLRSKLHTAKGEVRAACEHAIAKLEAQVGLPRPAEAAPPSVDTLPRATVETNSSRETLPRQVAD